MWFKIDNAQGKREELSFLTSHHSDHHTNLSQVMTMDPFNISITNITSRNPGNVVSSTLMGLCCLVGLLANISVCGGHSAPGKNRSCHPETNAESGLF
jgi:hypothetical protein